MNITLDRFAKKNTYTIGRLYIDGEYVCNTIEDTDRGLTQNMPVDKIKQIKVPGKTAIPSGVYEITLKIKSPKYSNSTYYVNFCNAYVPRLLNVPGYDGVLIHTGNTADDSQGCIIVGYNTIVGKVTDSKKAFQIVYNKLLAASKKEDKIVITIK